MVKAMSSPVKPLGYKVLVEIIPVQFTSPGGIILGTPEDMEAERRGRELARIVEFGPTAYKGFEGCEGPSDWGV